jgi:hypothetical protein
MQKVKAVKSIPSLFQKPAPVRTQEGQGGAAASAGVRPVRGFTPPARLRPAQLSAFEAEMLMEWSLP